MAACVVAIHTHPFESCSDQTILAIYNVFVSFAVPFFFLCSGFLIEEKIRRCGNSDDYVGIIWRYTVKTIKMYVLWSAAYLPLAIIDYISSEHSVIYCLLLYIRGFIFIGEHYNSWMLWYLLSTIYACCFIILCHKLHLSEKVVFLIGICIMVFGIFMTELVNYEGQLPWILNVIKSLIKLTVGNGRILSGMYYIPCGMMLSRSKLPKPVCIVSFVLLTVLAIACKNTVITSLLIMVDSVMLFEIIRFIRLKDAQIYPLLRYASKVMYFMHMYVWTAYYGIVYKTTTYGVDCFFVVFVVCILISLLLIVIKNMKKNIRKNDIVSQS